MANDTIVQDGNLWKDFNGEWKSAYILGFLNGYMKAICSCAATLTKTDEEYNQFVDAFTLITENCTYGKIIQVIDDIYSVDRYKIIKIDKLIEFVVIPSIKENWDKEKLYNETLTLLLIQERTKQ